jgi:hypothetical protein
VDPRSYIERIAQELSRAPGRGLVLSPRDAQLALQWHAQGVALEEVLSELRRAVQHTPPLLRGATRLGLSLQLIENAIASRRPRRPVAKADETSLSAGLLVASRSPVAGREVWHALAQRSEELLARGPQAYWSAAFAALLTALRELPRERVRELGRALRARMAPRPPTMGRAAYRKSLQLQLLTTASERLGVPPREFLL